MATAPSSTRALASLAPCELQPKGQAANEVDERLEAAARDGGARAVLEVVEQEGVHFTELNVITALQQVAEAAGPARERRKGKRRKGELAPEEVVRSQAFQALVDMVLAGLQRYEPALLAEAVRSCGRLGASEEMLLDEIGRHLMKVIHQLGAADIARLVEGFAALDHSPSLVLFESLAARAVEVAGDFSPEEREALRAGLQALGYADKMPSL